MRRAAAVSLGIVLAAAPAGALVPPRTPAVGMDVRLVLRGGERHRGTVSRLAADTLYVRECLECASAAYAVADVATLERWRSRTSIAGTATGAVSGAMTGAAIGAAAGALLDGPARHCGGECDEGRGLGEAAGAVAGGVVGLVTGTVVGAVRGRHGWWEPLTLPGP